MQYLHYQLFPDNPGKWAFQPIDESDLQDSFIETLSYFNVPHFICPWTPSDCPI